MNTKYDFTRPMSETKRPPSKEGNCKVYEIVGAHKKEVSCALLYPQKLVPPTRT